MSNNTHKYLILDRDGVIIKDVNLLTKIEEIDIYPESMEAFKLLKIYDYQVIVVTNQTVIARGLINESDLIYIHNYLKHEIYKKTNFLIKRFYYCPHHPNADIKKYRTICDCRKPRAGMLYNAAKKYDIDLSQSWMIGDRISDIIAGFSAGCRTIQLTTGRQTEKPIESDSIDLNVAADFVCKDLLDAVKLIINIEGK